MGVKRATCLSPQGELSRVPPATEHRRGARRAPAVKPPDPPRAPRAVQANANSLQARRKTHAANRKQGQTPYDPSPWPAYPA